MYVCELTPVTRSLEDAFLAITGTTPHDTNGSVAVQNLVEGDQAVVESPEGAFDPFVVHYAETFIVPAAVGRYTVTPLDVQRPGKEYGTMRASIRTNAITEASTIRNALFTRPGVGCRS